MDKNPDDIDLDQIMDLIEEENEKETTSFHQESPKEVEDELEGNSERGLKESASESKSPDANLVYETLNSNLALKKELDRLRVEKEEAERIALKGVLDNFQSKIDSSKSGLDNLKKDLVRAREEGDTAGSVEIESMMRDYHDNIRDLKSKLDTYSPLLDKPIRPAREEVAASQANTLASEWLKDNEHWLTDNKHSDKREYANNLFKEMQSNHNIDSLSFWTKFDKQIGEFESKKSQARMPKNMVTYNTNGMNSNSNRPTSYKQNPDFIQKVANLAKNVIGDESILQDKNMLNSMLKHYYKVYKDGNFKHIPTNISYGR